MMAERLRILIVEDDVDMVRLLQALLVQNDFGPSEHVSTGREAIDVADRFDLILLDHNLPDMTGVEAVHSLRAHANPPSVVVITAHGSEALAAIALRRGADDYLIKDASLPELLPQVLERVQRERALRAALTEARDELVKAERLAAIGEMTVTLHHEINNPLMAASAEVELLLARKEGFDPGQTAGLESIRTALHRIRDIVREVGMLREARTIDYPGNVRMIALADRGTALLYLPDDDLARITSSLLRAAGYKVQRCRTPDELRSDSAGLAVRLVAFAATRDAPTGGLSLDEDRRFRALAFVRDDETARRAAQSDLVVRVPFDPATLAEELAS